CCAYHVGLSVGHRAIVLFYTFLQFCSLGLLLLLQEETEPCQSTQNLHSHTHTHTHTHNTKECETVAEAPGTSKVGNSSSVCGVCAHIRSEGLSHTHTHAQYEGI